MSDVRKFQTQVGDAGARLATWLALRLGVAEEMAERSVVRGGVYVEGRRVRDPDVRLEARQRVAVHALRDTDAVPRWRIVHEDDDVLVVDKPASLPTQAAREGGASLDEEVAARIPGARLLHRIDRDTSGLVLFTRHKKAHARLQAALLAGNILREYLAVVAGVVDKDAFVVDAKVGPDPQDRRRQGVTSAGGKEARTEVVVVERGPDVTTLRCRLITGRTHQIRVHLAHLGHPILGDPLYAPTEVAARAPRLMLHAARLVWPGGHAESELTAG